MTGRNAIGVDGSVALSASHASQTGAPGRPGWLPLLLLLCPINLMMSLDKHAVGLASPLIAKEMHLGIVQMSVVVSAAYWSYAFLQIPSGWLVERFGYRRVLLVSLLSWATVTFLTAGVGGMVTFLLARLALGFGQAPDWPASIVAIKQWFGPEKRSVATSISLSALYLGILIGGPIAVWLIGLGGWRACMLFYAAAGFILAILWGLFAPKVVDHREQNESPLGFSTVLQVIAEPRFWPMALSYFLLTGLMSFYSTLFPTYLTAGRGVPLLSVGALLSVPYIGLYVAVLAAGRIIDTLAGRVGSRHRVSIGISLIGIGMATGGILFLPHISVGFGMGLCMAIALGGCGIMQVVLWSTIQSLADKRTAMISGWVSFWGNLSTGTVPIAIAAIQKATSSWTVALLLPAVMGMMLALVWITCLSRLAHADRAGSAA